MKKWFAASLLAMAMLVLSFANAVQAAFAENNTVTLVVVGDSQRGVILCPKPIEIEADDTALDVLQKEFGDKVDVSGEGEMAYVIGIDGLRQGDGGASSGWLYEVNGESPMVGAGSYKVSAGDVIAYRYTLDWGEDLKKQSLEESLQTLGGCEEAANPEIPPATNEPTKPADEQEPADQDDPVQSAELVQQVDQAVDKTAQYILNKGIESDWEAIGLMRSSAAVSDDARKQYLHSLEERVNTSQRLKGMTLARTILAVNATGGDPMDFAGKNLVEKLYNDELDGSINTYVFTLLALDSRDYEIPDEAKWTRERLIAEILNKQLPDGGWTFYGETGDPDMTGMALTALAPYQEDEEVAAAIEGALQFLSESQMESGGFGYDGVANANSTAAVLTGLASLGINPENSIVQNLLSFQMPSGGFKWLASDEKENGIATEQALYALVQYQYYVAGKGSIFHWDKQPPAESGEEQTPTTPDQQTDENGQEQPKEQPAAQPEQQETVQQTGQQVEQSTVQAEETEQETKAVNKQKLPDTAMFGLGFWLPIAAGIVLLAAAAFMWRKKYTA